MHTVLQALNVGLHEALDLDERVVFLGEDILDPYGGAFKVAQGLSTRFPDRVITTPISEMAIIGMASGLALRGLLPVVEIMFGDFLGIAYDQFLNHACKYRWMYNDRVRVPMVVRTPMGGRRGYGPTHSQSIEKHFLGLPGLRIVAPNSLSDVKALLLNCIFASDDPTLFVEHKLLYPIRLKRSADIPHLDVTTDTEAFPMTTVRVAGGPNPTVTVVTYGYMTELVLESVWRLAIEHEVFSEVFIPALIHPLNPAQILKSLDRTRRLITVEEGGVSFGWGSEIVSKAAEGAHFVAKRVGALDRCIPCCQLLEARVLPSIEDIREAIMQSVDSDIRSEVLR
jgi:pyruvate/2-oxoglutarate/acetoin dehydrogenase E1 component